MRKGEQLIPQDVSVFFTIFLIKGARRKRTRKKHKRREYEGEQRECHLLISEVPP